MTQEKLQITSYDVLGRPLGRNQLFYQGGAWSANYSTARTYDLAGNVLSQTYPSGKVVNYGYDQAARITSFTGNLGDGVTRTYSDNVIYNAASLMTQERLGVNALSANPGGLFVNKHYNKRLQNYDIRVGNNGADEWSWNRGALRLFYNSDYSDYNATPTGANNNGNLYRMDHFIPDNESISSWKMSSGYYGYDPLNRLQWNQENQVNNGVETVAYKQTNAYDRWGNRTIDQNNTWAMDGTVWVEDSLPTGAVAVGDADGWNWVTASPAAFSGSSSHQSANLTGVHQHYFYGATTTLTPSSGENLYAWVYLDPTNPPTEVMLQWNNGDWEHRAYWGANQIGWGVDGTNSRRYMGALPATGGWVRLEVPASQVGLVGSTINGMAFSLYGGKATWDRAGKTAITGGGINKELYTVNTTNNRFTELTYDAAGNVKGEKSNGSGRMEYQYDAENHVIAYGYNIITTPGNPVTSRYFYDANGKRTRKIVSGTETWFVYGLDGELVAEYNVNAAVGSPNKEYGYRGGQLLVVYDNTEPIADKKLQWLVADHLGTPRMVIDKTGSLSGMKRHDYLPFGEEIGANVGIRSAGNGYTADQIRQKFTGKRRDDEMNLDFFEARYFSSIHGRFTSPDPILMKMDRALDPQRLNLYCYTRNNPLIYIDPDGRDIKYKHASEGKELTQQQREALQDSVRALREQSTLANLAFSVYDKTDGTGPDLDVVMMPDSDFDKQPDVTDKTLAFATQGTIVTDG
ncbi:MAG: RHS repeat-associated core domain-containing protein, partial [Blastocatellia bacterium]|nr:RHS repeat-associated core domain-containing protein [Blastocatellia bacterium]